MGMDGAGPEVRGKAGATGLASRASRAVGRRLRRSAEAGRELLARWAASGQRVGDFCRREQIPLHVFYYWKRRTPKTAAPRLAKGAGAADEQWRSARRTGDPAMGWPEAQVPAPPRPRETAKRGRPRPSSRGVAATPPPAAFRWVEARLDPGLDATPGRSESPAWLGLRLRDGRELRFTAETAPATVQRWAEVLEREAPPC